MEKDIVVCVVAILICHFLTYALAAMECRPGSLQQQKVEEQNRLKNFVAEQIVPDAMNSSPESALSVAYRPGVAANLGNVLRAEDVQEAPKLAWTANVESFYTLIALDLDAPSRSNPVNRGYQHWLVGNIQGGHVERGEIFTKYKPPGPPANSGLHRYVFLVFRQPGQITFHEPHLDLGPASKTPGAPSRSHFNLRDFIKKYGLGETPVAGNFFQVQHS